MGIKSSEFIFGGRIADAKIRAQGGGPSVKRFSFDLR
jgi:hypothetical protein